MSGINISLKDTSVINMSLTEMDELLSDFFRLYILTILYEGPTHGYNIISKFKRRMGKEISPSLVYPFLKQLEQKGLVKHSLKPVGAKKKKVFELTDEGKKFCRNLFKRFSALVSVAIEPSLEVCANCGCKVYDGGYREVINGEEMAFCCVHCAESYKHEISEKAGKTKE
ncbi:helix-turn-helix transcriptional regulator [Candidatus Bathyarchaeota archaeon]|nr:helix-turn-helix transcriptional regulator [Candidatus Bathyarchaeota archaeon]MBS7631340.1 helix-turn-helix transcriptional regulator [Candidatus Bathyarchaeota archaeon]